MFHSATSPRARKARFVALWVAVLSAGLGTCLGLRALTAQEAEDPLWYVYSSGSPEKRALTAECQKRLAALRGDAEARNGAVAWTTDPNVRWLLEHRTPTALVIERHMAGDVSGPYLVVLTGLAERLGHIQVTRKLPSLLAKARSEADCLVVLRALSNVRTPEAVQALSAFLQGAKPKTPEALVCEAARGLGETRDEQHLAALRACDALVSSPLGKACLATALLRCGDQTALPRLLAPLREPDPDAAVCTYVLGVLAEYRGTEVVGELARFAVESVDPDLAEAGFHALQRATGAMDPMASASREPEEGPGQQDGPPAPEEGGQEDADELPDWGAASRTERQAAADMLLQQWRVRGAPRGPASLTSETADM
jgi:hypothetical protein